MIYRILADLVVTIHLAFIIFVVFGGFLTIRWNRLWIFHLPSAIWGALIEFQGWLCPLTTLEWRLRRIGGQSAYEHGFIEHYIVPIVYPDRLTPELQTGLGAAVLVLNGTIYCWLLWRRRRDKR
ncbi:MAG: hypothetical protein A4E66_01331 [Syntrophus sp. PtaB.Bin001]|nr:MAG: hypothetical protein A4E66_01331 [Syntrophus sp. PtaB.Bin001]